MDIINNPRQELIDQLQKQMDDENQKNPPEGIGIFDLGSDFECWHCMALDRGVPLGTATVHGNELYKLYVAPSHRKKNIAEKLVNHVMFFLKEHGKQEMHVEMTQNSLPFWAKFIEKNRLEFEIVYGGMKVFIKFK